MSGERKRPTPSYGLLALLLVLALLVVGAIIGYLLWVDCVIGCPA